MDPESVRVSRFMWMALFACGAPVAAFAQTPVDLCGRLVQGTECRLFEDASGVRYVLTDLAQFENGDRVRVIGVTDADCASICQEGVGCIAVASIGYCDGAVTICGRLEQGVECVLLRDDKGPLFVLENRGNFSVGDRVRVQGTFERDCVSICMQGDGCIRSNTISAHAADSDCSGSGGGGGGAIVCPASTLGLLAFTMLGVSRMRRRAV